jgi:prepilin-type N-terminal cleavage/methylation domain-containing protein
MKRRVEEGFTLVELVAAVVVIGIIGTSITALFLNIQQIQISTNYLESATRAAQLQVESLRNSNYNNLTPGSTINFTDELPDDLPQDSTGTVAVSEPSPGIRRVDVTVAYTFDDKPRTVEMSSLIGVIGITQ